MKKLPNISIFILLLSFVYFSLLYIYNLSRRFFWYDEIIAYKISSEEGIIATFMKAAQIDTQPPLFYLLAKPFIFSEDPFFIRLSIFLPFLGCLFIYYKFFKQQSLFFLAIISFFILAPATDFYSSEFRPYTISAFIF